MVRPSVGKRLVLSAGLLVTLVLVLGCPLGLVGFGTDGGLPLVFVLGVVVFAAVVGVGLQLYLTVTGGPVLAANQAGLWIKTRPTRGQAIWLPWEGVARIYRRRWSFERMVCVAARDPRAASHLGAFTALDSGLQKAFFGSGFTATLNFADKPEAEIMAAIAHFSAGRCPIS